ncbi:unnamed protein product [Cuscuta campestris]|uniref:Uncharacterized protein n=1 Tax=Cuscuta campestris TaxID=132261 RepID=A0A484N843_9ASTE|nr:unnamed protein product [Cuscuta campestris]
MWGRHRSLTECMYLSSAILADYGYAEEMEQLLQGTRWHRLFTMRAESSLPLTIKFLCSLELEPSTRRLGVSSTESNDASSFAPSTSGASLQVSSKRATRRRPTTSQTPAAPTQADLILEWARRIMEQQETILQRMSEIGQQHASQAESFTQLRNIFIGFHSDVHIGLTPRSPEGDDPSSSAPPPQ